VGGVEFGKFPFGACEEPISELHLATTWPHLTEGIVVDNDVYSDLDPLQAPHWSVRVRTAENPQCLLGEAVTELFKLCCRTESTEEIPGRGYAEDEGKENSDISSALSKLTEPAATVPISKLSVSNMVHSARKHIRRHRRIDESPLNTEILNSVLLYLFPDAAVEKSDFKNNTQLSNSSGTSEQEKTSDYLKSAPSDSLTYRLALCVCLVNYYYGGLRAVGHLWQEFVLELRYRWENNHLICGLAGGAPDLRCCLLHQKFQMLNCCIERKKARDESHKVPEGKEKEHRVSGACQKSRQGPECATSASSSTREMSQGKSWDSWSDSEEEFFECLSDQGETEATQAEGRAEGRLHPHNNMTLLNSAEPLYVPVTQEPAPMTEDLLAEQSEVLTKLGTSAEGTHLRARMQSACLLSDMESFKAVNPGCVLEDFVRWYSPRDYVEEEVVDEKGNTMVTGTLSPRMKIPGNMWVEAWETARVTPARRKKRLFDDTKEAEKVLHYMAMQKPADLARHLLPCILHATILKLKEEGKSSPFGLSRQLFLSCVQDFINQLLSMETVITQARSLKAKFSIPEDDSGEAAALLAPVDEDLGSDKKQTGGSSRVPDFPPPAGREILLRTCVPRPAAYSKALPQRLFCVLMREEFRLAGAFSTDTSFF
uniref:Rab3 GTPase-activating protein catalytic subunit n=1 Tax=Astatotilapia calliptera TaxID=8154 RepID=A0AAX7U9F6_ASTCA